MCTHIYPITFTSIFLLMFSWLQKTHIKYINFENMQDAIQSNKAIIVNVLHSHEQSCLIKNTVLAHDEEKIINEMLFSFSVPDKPVIVYGKNDTDELVETKYEKLVKLGVENVYIYKGGMFEWMLLQDIYGAEEFPTTSKQMDIILFRPLKIQW